jgi:hypothetical protein
MDETLQQALSAAEVAWLLQLDLQTMFPSPSSLNDSFMEGPTSSSHEARTGYALHREYTALHKTLDYSGVIETASLPLLS